MSLVSSDQQNATGGAGQFEKRVSEAGRHTRWVRICHWIVTVSFLTLAFTGFVILMAHPRLYWGEVGNDLTPALLELPISRNHQHDGWAQSVPFSDESDSPVSASRTYEILNQNSWGNWALFRTDGLGMWASECGLSTEQTRAGCP